MKSSKNEKRRFPVWRKCERCGKIGHRAPDCFSTYDKQGMKKYTDYFRF